MNTLHQGDQATIPPGVPATNKKANTPEVRQRLQEIIDTLQPEVRTQGLHILIPFQDDTVHYPTNVKRGTPDLAREYVSQQYKLRYHVPMSLIAYKQVVKEIVAASPEGKNLLPDDLLLVAGTTDLYISLSAGRAFQRKGKDDKAVYLPVFFSLPMVNAVYHTPNGAKGTITQYDVTIDGVNARLTSDEMSGSKWKEHFPRLQGVGNFHTTGMYVQILQHLAHSAELIHTVTHTGVHHLANAEGKKVFGFMLPTGKFYTGNTPFTGNVAYTRDILPDDREKWETYDTIASEWNQRAATNAIQYMKRLTPVDGQALISVCHQVRCLARWVRNSTFRTGYCLYMYGPGGSGKTSLGILTASVGKPYVHPEGIDTSFRSTVTSIESKIDGIGDTPFIIDDLNKAPDESGYTVQQREKTVDAIARSAYDSSPIRERMNSNMTAQRVNTVKTYPTVTGEYFPTNMATSFMRRVLFLHIPENSIPKKGTETAVCLENAGNYHASGLHMLGRRIQLYLLDKANCDGLPTLSRKLQMRYDTYTALLTHDIGAVWLERGYATLPANSDNIIDAAANVMVGAYLIDNATMYACNTVDVVRGYLVNAVVMQLQVMNGTYQIDGMTPLDHALRELFTSVAEEKKVNQVLLRVEDYFSAAAPSVALPVAEGATAMDVPALQWTGVTNSKADKQVAAYIHKVKNIVYLTSVGRDALLSIAATMEDLRRIKTPTALAKQLDSEKWLMTRTLNDKHLDVPCKPQGKVLVRCYPLSLDKILALLFSDAIDDETPNATNQPIPLRIPDRDAFDGTLAAAGVHNSIMASILEDM